MYARQTKLLEGRIVRGFLDGLPLIGLGDGGIPELGRLNAKLAPLTGLAEAIVDLTATGTTLRENGLVVREEIAACTARLIANPVAHKLRAAKIDALLERLNAV